MTPTKGIWIIFSSQYVVVCKMESVSLFYGACLCAHTIETPVSPSRGYSQQCLSPQDLFSGVVSKKHYHQILNSIKDRTKEVPRIPVNDVAVTRRGVSSRKCVSASGVARDVTPLRINDYRSLCSLVISEKQRSLGEAFPQRDPSITQKRVPPSPSTILHSDSPTGVLGLYRCTRRRLGPFLMVTKVSYMESQNDMCWLLRR